MTQDGAGKLGEEALDEVADRGNIGIGSRSNSLSALMRGTSKRADGWTVAPGENGLASSAEKRRTYIYFEE
jgi:hypothetical protein